MMLEEAAKTYLPIIALSAVGAVSLAVTLEVVTRPPPHISRVEDAGGTTVAPKQDRGLMDAHAVRTIPISPLPQQSVAAPAILPSVDESPGSISSLPVPVAKARDTLDICQRHGGHKENYQRGRYTAWRCVFSKR